VARSKQLDYQLIKLIASGYLPFSLVQNEHFKEFVKMLNPSYVLPSRKTASHNLLDQVYTRLVEAVKRELATATAITVTTDGWTSMSNNNNNNSLFTPRKQLQEKHTWSISKNRKWEENASLAQKSPTITLELICRDSTQKSNSLQ
jgi:hypothetical protein